MEKRKRSAKTVSETNLGIYVWQLPEGGYLMDDDFNVLSVQAFRGDLRAMTAIGRVARGMGYEGSAVFAEGHRKISDTEFEIQRERFINGLVPDIYDIGNFKDGLKNDNN